jgi:hypothetical protein
MVQWFLPVLVGAALPIVGLLAFLGWSAYALRARYPSATVLQLPKGYAIAYVTTSPPESSDNWGTTTACCEF